MAYRTNNRLLRELIAQTDAGKLRWVESYSPGHFGANCGGVTFSANGVSVFVEMGRGRVISTGRCTGA